MSPNTFRKNTAAHVRDWAGKYSENKPDAPYQDFWHWMCDHNEVSNPCVASIDSDYIDDEEPWVKEVIEHIMKEFATPEDNGFLNFWVSW